jgi:hypothetical protein
MSLHRFAIVMVTRSKMPKPICLQGMGILMPPLMVDFLRDIKLSFGMVMILTISQKKSGNSYHTGHERYGGWQNDI